MTSMPRRAASCSAGVVGRNPGLVTTRSSSVGQVALHRQSLHLVHPVVEHGDGGVEPQQGPDGRGARHAGPGDDDPATAPAGSGPVRHQPSEPFDRNSA